MDDEVRQGSFAPGLICTFYSFKGGVGRSMALANVAAMLSKMGARVLVMDWDLEAPGLEKYFSRRGISLDRSGTGIVDIVTSYSRGEEIDWRSGLLRVPMRPGKPIDILHAGRKDEGYIERLGSIVWRELFANGIGTYLERLRDEFRREYEFILIDSRTGTTDAGGICTILLPDIVVPIFTTNEQSLEGVEETMRRAQQVHASMPLERNKLLIVPVPGRDESQTEYEKAREWRMTYASRLRAFYEEWIPAAQTAERVLDYLKIPHVPFWSFGEALPVLEEATDNPKNLAYSYAILARLLHSRLDWSEIQQGGRAGFEAEARQLEASVQHAKQTEEVRLRALEREQRIVEERLADLKAKVIDRADRLAIRINDDRRQRTRVTWLSLGGAVGMGLLAAFFWVWSDNILKPVSYQQDQALRTIPLVLAAISTFGLLAVYWSVLTTPRLVRASRRLEEERVAFEVGRGPYKDLGQEAAIRLLSERIEVAAAAGVMDRAVMLGSEQSPATTSTTIITNNYSPPLDAATLPKVPGDPQPLGPFDVFLAHPTTPIARDWVREFTPLFTGWLAEFLGREPRVLSAVDFNITESADEFSSHLKDILVNAKVGIVVITQGYLRSEYGKKEFGELASRYGAELIPLCLDAESKADSALREWRIVDFSDLAYLGEGFRKSDRSLDFQDRIKVLARSVSGILDSPQRVVAA